MLVKRWWNWHLQQRKVIAILKTSMRKKIGYNQLCGRPISTRTHAHENTHTKTHTHIRVQLQIDRIIDPIETNRFIFPVKSFCLSFFPSLSLFLSLSLTHTLILTLSLIISLSLSLSNCDILKRYYILKRKMYILIR